MEIYKVKVIFANLPFLSTKVKAKNFADTAILLMQLKMLTWHLPKKMLLQRFPLSQNVSFIAT